jgi:aspartate racemase
MRVPGIIGGLGPDTTAVFYKALVQASDSRGGAHRPGMLTWSVPIDYKHEREAIQFGSGEDRLLPMLYDSVERLERGGADFLVMPCNSLHVFHSVLQRHAQVPFISIVEETAKLLSQSGFSRVALLGSPITLGKEIYQSALHSRGISTVVPSSSDTELLASMIHRLVAGQRLEDDGARFEALVEKLHASGADTVVLACTDLQLLLSPALRPLCVDTLQVLVEATIREVFKRPGSDMNVSPLTVEGRLTL